MSERRALLTDREREIIAGEADVKDSYRYQTISRVRSRFDRLESDLEVFRKHGGLLEDLQEIVCAEPQEGHRTPVEQSPTERDVSPEPVEEPRESEPAATETGASTDAELEDQLRSTLPGSGSVLEDRIDAVLKMYNHLRNNQGETVRTGELKALIDGDNLGYRDIDSFWTNAVKKNAAQDRPNSLTSLPSVDELGNGRYQYTGEP